MDSSEELHINRFFVEVVQAWTQKHGGTCTRHFGDWIMELMVNGVTKHVVWYDLGLNSSTQYQTMKDKAATSWILERAGVPTVEHVLLLRPDSQGWDAEQEAKQHAFVNRVGFPLVMKPNGGSNGTGVQKIESQEALNQSLREYFELHRAVALSPFLTIVKEYRVTMLDGEVLLIYAKEQHNHKEFRFNLSHGATVVDVDATERARVSPVAKRALEALGARFANVDIVLTAENELCVLEVNGGVAFEKYAALSDDHRARAEAVYSRALNTLFGIL